CRENGGSPPIRLHADVMTRVWRYGSIAGGCRGRPMARWRGQFMGVEMAVTVVVPGLETPRQSRAEPGTGNWRGSPARQLVGAQGLIAIAIHRIEVVQPVLELGQRHPAVTVGVHVCQVQDFIK